MANLLTVCNHHPILWRIILNTDIASHFVTIEVQFKYMTPSFSRCRINIDMSWQGRTVRVSHSIKVNSKNPVCFCCCLDCLRMRVAAGKKEGSLGLVSTWNADRLDKRPGTVTFLGPTDAVVAGSVKIRLNLAASWLTFAFWLAVTTLGRGGFLVVGLDSLVWKTSLPPDTAIDGRVFRTSEPTGDCAWEPTGDFGVGAGLWLNVWIASASWLTGLLNLWKKTAHIENARTLPLEAHSMIVWWQIPDQYGEDRFVLA